MKVRKTMNKESKNEKMNDDQSLDYTNIKAEFNKANKPFPLTEKECIGLTKAEQDEINPCGTYCGGCEDYGVVCDGCRNRNGKPIWYNLYDKKETCIYYTCTNNKSIHNCSTCSKLPCKDYFIYPDPNMSDEFKQYWLNLRIKNLKKVNPNITIELEDEYRKNVEKFNK
ncbi:DUF3795 domain-containing protein [Anaerosporobacter faecicola]|uniref:DUF3795 domain-containing protein n=1 Tax=Anaerosporobacter faecicola TaxID=2718714 RepID=UPI00143CA268|nr:DUF3795 domain-containing protein [Anaerosporobacter faecicola]